MQHLPQRLAAGCRPHTAAKVHQRPLSSVQQVCRPLDLLGVKGGHRADGLRLLGGKFTHCGGDVLGDIHQHRTFAPALGNAERRPHGVGQLADPAHRKVMLGNGHRDALDIGFLETVAAQAGGRHVAGKGHHRHRVHICSGNAGDQVGRTRPAGGQHHTGAAGSTGIAVCCMRRPLLVGGQHVLDPIIVAVQLVIQVQHRAAGIAKNRIHTLLTKHLYKNLRTVQLHKSCLPWFLCWYARFGGPIRPARPLSGKKKAFVPCMFKRQRLCNTQSSLRYHSR